MAAGGLGSNMAGLKKAAKIVGPILSLPPLGRIRHYLNVRRPSKRSAAPVRIETQDAPHLVVASHNIMNGNKLQELLPRYEALRAHKSLGLDVLMVQEDKRRSGTLASARLAEGLGRGYVAVSADSAEGLPEGGQSTRLAMVYDAERLELVEQKVVLLPKVARLTRGEQLVIKGGTVPGSPHHPAAGAPEQKYVQIVTFRPLKGGERFTAVNFHLDAAGSTDHRRAQMGVVADAVEQARRRGAARAVIGGDTNAWRRPDGLVQRIDDWTNSRPRRRARVGRLAEVLVSLAAMTYTGAKKQRSVLARIAEPLTRIGAADPGTEPTHVLSRMQENHEAHDVIRRLYRQVGDHNARIDGMWTVGFDHPVRGPVSRVLDASGSDHRVVYRVLKL